MMNWDVVALAGVILLAIGLIMILIGELLS